MKKNWIYLAGLCILALQANCQHATTAQETPTTSVKAVGSNTVPNTILDLDLKGVSLKGVEPAPVSAEWQAMGFKVMPVYSTDAAKVSEMAASDCIAYYRYDFYVPNDDIQGAGVFIYEFPDKQKLDNFLEASRNNHLRRHLSAGNFYIQIWSFDNDGDTAEEHLNVLQNYYEELGASLYINE